MTPKGEPPLVKEKKLGKFKVLVGMTKYFTSLSQAMVELLQSGLLPILPTLHLIKHLQVQPAVAKTHSLVLLSSYAEIRPTNQECMRSRSGKQLPRSNFVRGLSATLLFAALFLAPSKQADAGELYAYRSNRGVVTFTTSPPKGSGYWKVRPRQPKYSSIVRRTGRSSGGRWSPRARRSAYDDLILSQAKQYSLEPALVKAVVHAESAFNPSARSYKGAMGLMQLMPATARRFGVYDAYSPNENVHGGVKYLRWLLDRFKGNITYVLAGYNAGEGAVDRYNGIPPYSETQTYVRRVLRLRDLYRCDYTGRKAC